MPMAEASVIEQRVAVTKPGRLHGGDGSIDCEILSLARWGAQVRLLGALGAQRELFLSIDGFGQLSCRVTEVVGDIADLRFEGDAESQEAIRSEEHTSELQSLMRISYAVFCLKKKKQSNTK